MTLFAQVLRLAVAVAPEARSFLLFDGLMQVPEVSTSYPFGVGLVLVVAVLRKTAYAFLLLDGFVHMPEVSPSRPFRMTLMVRVLVDPHRPHLPRRYADRRRRPTRSTLGAILPASRPPGHHPVRRIPVGEAYAAGWRVTE
jgi:hypothetical protein